MDILKLIGTKAIIWVKVVLAGFLGLLEILIKIIKEITTFILDVFFPIIPKFEVVVRKVREFCNIFYDKLSDLKEILAEDVE